MQILRALTAFVVVIVGTAAVAPTAVTAADPAWTATRLTNSYSDGSPCVAADATGTSYVVFGRQGHLPGLWLSTNRSGSWRTSRLTAIAGDACETIATDPGRHLHVLIRRASTGQAIYLTNASGTWRSRVISSGAGAASLSLAADRHGRVAIAIETEGRITVASNQTGRWRSSVAVPGAVTAVSRLAFDPAGRLWIAYQISSRVVVASNPGGKWRHTIIDRPGDVFALDLGIDARGLVFVALEPIRGPISVLSDRSGAWRTISTVKTSANLRALAVTPGGRLHVVLESVTGVLSDRTNRSGPWHTRTLAVGANSGALAVDRAGHVTAAWSAGDLAGSIFVASDRTGSLRTRRLTAGREDRILALASDMAGRRYLVLDRAGVGAATLLATDRSGTWSIASVAAEAWSAAIAVDAAGTVHLAFAGGSGPGYAREVGGTWTTEALPTLYSVLLVVPDAAAGDRVVGTRGADVVVLRDGPAGWSVETSFTAAGACTRAAVDLLGRLEVACATVAGLGLLTYAADTWTSTIAATPSVPWHELAPEAVAVDAAGAVSIAYTEFADDTGPDGGTVYIASNAGGPWAVASPGVAGFVGYTGLALDPAGYRHLLAAGSGLTETTDASGGWVSSTLPLASGPTVGRIDIGASGTVTVAAELGANAIAEAIETPISDGGIVVLSR